MRTYVKLLVSAIFFLIDVQVRAANLELPRECWSKNITPCTILVNDEVAQFTFNDQNLRLQPGTIIKKNDDSSFTLVKGRALFESASKTSIQSLHGKVEVNAGRALLVTEDEKTTFTNLKGILNYVPRGSLQSGQLPVGFSNFMGRVSSDGVSPSGYSAPAIIANLISDWSFFYKKSEKAEFIKQVSELAPGWQNAIQVAGPWYVETAARQLASLNAERARQAKIREEKRKEEEYYRHMFRRRNMLE